MNDEIARLRERAALLERLQAEFPDLRTVDTRWKPVLVSSRVNEAPEKVETKHACGCCNDAPLQAWFYVERHGERIYTDPPEIWVASQAPYHTPADRWYADWEDIVRKHAGEAGVELLRPRATTVVTYDDEETDA